jgi:hypothetical protein
MRIINPCQIVSREYASGGGDVCFQALDKIPDVKHHIKVPEFKWHIIDENVPFEIGETGVNVLPFAGPSLCHFAQLRPSNSVYL